MRSGLGGHEILNLYAEGIAKMPENPGIPLLFRDIFKNAYLPYRDPETLRAFLKIIDEFTYDHSERLGDAFEYLLSVLSSQGDAGQFRTPRHIIDFMVEIIDPKKTETVLDPACGTAGFLISSYKHILKANTDAKGNSTLTPDDKGRLAQNFKGYDISPDMVRLSLVNLYLHGFADPHIAEYDTLTSQDRWNEYADVILANPPFMSPKGGIKPHNRFSVPSKRSEVLFVDYMAEHLTPSGRAGIIVPEGIIFQSQTAYEQLRKLLVEEYLVAVVSLPAGVFNPYSGVKTSILILDKSLARKTDTIGFFKIENDGFGLGAQRREIDKNDLPQAHAEIGEYLSRLRAGETVEEFQPALGRIVPKEKIAANGEYNLSGERYRESSETKRRFAPVELGTICKPEYGFTASAADNGDTRFVRITDIGPDGRLRKEDPKFIKLTSESEQYLLKKGDLLVARTGATFGKTMLFDEDYPAVFASYLIRLRFPPDRILPKFYWVFAQTERYWEQAHNLATGGGQPQFNGNALTQIKIPLPPLEVQKEIVAEIEGYQKVINGARAVLDNYRPHIPIHPDSPMVELGEVCVFKRGPFGGSLKKEIFVKTGYAVYEQSHAIANDFSEFRYFVDEDKFAEMHGFQVRPGELIMSCSGTMGKVAIIPDNAPAGIINQALLKLTPKDCVLGVFLKLWMESTNFQESLADFTYGAAIKNVASVEILKGLRLPLPPLATQQVIVAEIEAEQALVAANRELIARFETKIQATLARVWGEDEPTPVEA
jgi:type I restriction enzyme M protein